MSLDLFSLRKDLGEAGALLTFSGSFSHSLIEELGMAMRRHLESDEVHKSAIMDVFSVFIEASQNIRNYTNKTLLASENHSTTLSSIVVITRQQDKYEVNAGNMIKNSDIPALEERLAQLTSLDKSGLKALYKENLRKKRDPEATGAGLGLIDMARKASKSLDFSFVGINEAYSFFSLCVVI